MREFNLLFILLLLHPLLLIEKGVHKLTSIDRHLLGQFIEAFLDLVLALDTFLLHFDFDLLQLLFLLLFQLDLLLGILLLCCQGKLYLEPLLDFARSLILRFSVFFQEVLNFIIFLLL